MSKHKLIKNKGIGSAEIALEIQAELAAIFRSEILLLHENDCWKTGLSLKHESSGITLDISCLACDHCGNVYIELVVPNIKGLSQEQTESLIYTDPEYNVELETDEIKDFIIFKSIYDNSTASFFDVNEVATRILALMEEIHKKIVHPISS
ncbi:hypothetical protein [[Clostridium] fimetarium]|uniref:Uncharacterized protein n=1 Tax=[Clostridium] fimetarium TaxID=99656 RepID=A0A1I0QVX3_9FIRM|nr:hypothetical protein [[Clostridium] fimetarium]SEW31600.1 hypothetical protein SAMN05421659_109164 [[Clostridium] fimetarium]